ncbi:MAG: spore coat protein U domain-containing protein [Acidobacteria bacterium]|nr:spore coat protein U domain-containing protein [Acidobacteriota bacterium]
MTKACGVLLVVAAVAAVPRAADAACTITTTSIRFGAYDPLGTSPNDSTGTVTYRCAPPDRNVSIMLGTGASGSFNPRQLSKGVEQLSYNLYRDAARSVTWGDGTGGTSFYFDADPPNWQDVVLTIYARVPAGQDISAGSYTDGVSVVINF